MSSFGFEYGTGGGFGGSFDPLGGYGPFGSDVGGGFMNSDEKGAKSSDKKASRDKQTLIPLSVKQLLGASQIDDAFRVDDVELHTIKLVGNVFNLQEHSTNFIFNLNDGSGTIECKQWIEKDAVSFSKIGQLREGFLVRVVGNVREYEGKLYVMAFDAAPVVDWNELTYHTLDVVLTHLRHTKGPIGGPTANSMTSGGLHTPAAFNRGLTGPSGGFAGVSLNSSHLKKESQGLHQAIFEAYLTGLSRPEGLSYTEVMNVLRKKGHNITLDQLSKCVLQLCDDGRLYTTVDDDHYRPTMEEY